MKKIFTIFLLLCSSSLLFAGQGGPDTWGYTWKDSNEPGGPVYSWIEIVGQGGTEVKLLGDDNSRGPFPMTFDFHYYWYDVNTFWVGSNGYMLFMNGQLASPFSFSPVSTLPNDVIAAFMNDLTFAGLNDSAECYYRVNAAKDTLIVSWINVPYWDSNNSNGQSGNNTFQIILSNVDSSITFQYKDVTPANPYNGANSAVGIENNSGIIGLFYNSSTFISPPENFAIKYYYPPNPTLEVSDASVVYCDNPETGAIFLTNDGNVHNLTAQVKNTGSISSSPYNVLGVVKDPAGTQVVSNFFLTDTLSSGEIQDFTFSQQLNPVLTGTYKYFATSQLPGDNPPQNNSKTQEIVVIDPSLPEVRLGYDAGLTNQLSPINWVGGVGGVGTYIIPPFYPATITKLHYWNLSNISDAFSARVFDDDGINGLPFTMYDSIYVPSTDVILNGWTDIELLNPITITSGGFYLSWDEHGESIQLGCSTAPPISNRSFELFDNIWGIFRYRETQDPLINATIFQGFPTGVNAPANEVMQLQLTPNPASDHTVINYTAPASNEKVWLMITDLQGKMINRWYIGNGTGMQQSFSIDTHGYAAGMYLIQLYSGTNKKTEKLVITD